MCLEEIAAACRRVALGNGLPPDGHLVHAALQGQAAFYWSGPCGELSVIAVPGSESGWNVASSKLPLIVEGESSAGEQPGIFAQAFAHVWTTSFRFSVSSDCPVGGWVLVD